MVSGDPLHPSDRALIDVDLTSDRQAGRFTLGPGLVRHDGALYGGTGLAVSVMAMQAASGREVLWASTQFVSSPRLGAVIDWQVETLARGKRSSQLLVRARCDGTTAFLAIGAAGVGDDSGLTGQYVPFPEAAPPDDARPWDMARVGATEDSWWMKLDLREAELVDPRGRSALWARRRDGLAFTPAAVAFAADFVPLGVARSAGRVGAGSSLDNSMRFRPGEGGEWLLLELEGDMAWGGYGHGTVRAWSPDGSLLATGSQTAAMRYLVEPGGPLVPPGLPPTIAAAPTAD